MDPTDQSARLGAGSVLGLTACAKDMPATQVNPLASAVLRTSNASFSPFAFGLAAPIAGLLLNSFAINPTRDLVRKKDHTGHEGIVDIMSNPQIKASIDAENMSVSDPMANPHPGAALSPAAVAPYTANLSHGFPTSGIWVMGNPTRTATPAELQKITFELTLRWTPSTAVQIIQDTDAI